MKLPEELKEAISHLPSVEKDKLIFRLLRKDLTLANRLLFELVSENTVEESRNDIERLLKKLCERATLHFYSPGYLNMDIRYMSGLINDHVSTTKDKYGEAWLNIFILNEILELNKKNLNSYTGYEKLEKLYIAIIARVFKILLIVSKLHEDYLIEFEPELEKLGNKISNIPILKDTSIDHGLDVNWLIDGNIPDDIVSIHKNLREHGYLKA